MENDTGIQETSSSLMVAGNVLRDEAKKVCRGEGLSEKEIKKDLLRGLLTKLMKLDITVLVKWNME
ncbi:13702_t:CDS:2, partial [Cetraspora pellucida]